MAEGSSNRSGWRAWVQEILFHGLLGLAFVLLAWLSVGHVWHWDWTAAQRNSLAPESQALLKRLEGPLTLTAYAPPQGALGRRLTRLLEPYQRARPEWVSVQFLDPELHPEQARAAGVELTGELVLDYQGRTERLRSLGENQIANALQRLLGRPERWIGALSGHGERSATGQANHDLGRFGQDLEARGYRVQTLGPEALLVLPDNLGLLLIAGPQVAFLPGEVARVRAYLQAGGHLLWLLDPDGLWGLEDLARDLGVAMLPGVVLDTHGGELGIQDPSVALVAQYPEHPITKDLGLLSLFPRAAALEARPVGDWRASPLLVTQERVWNETGPLRGAVKQNPELGERAGPLTLGLALSRGGVDGAREQRVLVVGDGDFLANAFLGNGGNRELGLRLVRWLLEEDRLLEVPPREVPDRALVITPQLALGLGGGTLVLAPLAFLLAGLLIRRHRQRG